MIKIDLKKIQETVRETQAQPTPKKRIIKILIFVCVFVLIAASTFSMKVIFSNEGIVEDIKSLPLLREIGRFAENADKKILGEDSGRVNILLLGIGGNGHTAGDLADTLILASIKLSTQQVALVSFPRDMIVPIPKYGWRKINTINALAEQTSPGSGSSITAQTIGKLLNQNIPYYVRVDFTSFTKFIDHVGGIDVFVENTLDDYSYPTRGKEDIWPISARYEHLRIEKGWQHMDGELALKYARSRHALGVEGSDFARAKRQQKIITALKDKILSLNVLLNPKKISTLISDFRDNVSTNLRIWEMLRLANIGRAIEKEHIIQKVLDNSSGGLLAANITQDGAYILEPRNGDFTEIQALVENIFNVPADSSTAAEKKTSWPELENAAPSYRDEQSRIEIQNGTNTDGLAWRTKEKLESFGIDVVQYGNATQRDYEKTVVYDLSGGKKPKTLQFLKETLNANVSLYIPAWLKESAKTFDPSLATSSPSNIIPNLNADILIILGPDAADSLK